MSFVISVPGPGRHTPRHAVVSRPHYPCFRSEGARKLGTAVAGAVSGLRPVSLAYNALVSLFEPLFAALNETGVRYVVVGGLATVLHGYARLTADVDMVVDLQPERARTFILALQRLGFEPRAPVHAVDFADSSVRRTWTAEKGMRVFSMVDRKNPMRVVDMFVEHPIEFEGLWSRAETVELETTAVRIAAIPDLIELKRQAGRPQDLDDIEQLERILRRRGAADA